MFRLIAALLRHAFRILSFRHDGTGLPARHSGVTAFIVILFLTLATVRWSGFHGTSATHLLVGQLLYLIIVVGLMRPAACSALLLSSIGVDLVALLLYAMGFYPGAGALKLMMLLWEIGAFVVCLVAMAEKKRTEA